MQRNVCPIDSFTQDFFFSFVILFFSTLLTTADATESALITTAEADWNEDSVCITDNCMQTSINILQNSDFTVDPCDDFYKYTCGNFFE